MHETNTKKARAQFDLNLKITKLELKSQPPTLPKVRKSVKSL